jgi:hypothetical protein
MDLEGDCQDSYREDPKTKRRALPLLKLGEHGVLGQTLLILVQQWPSAGRELEADPYVPFVT